MTGNCALNISILVNKLDNPFKASQTNLANLDQHFHWLTQLTRFLCLILNPLHNNLGRFNNGENKRSKSHSPQMIAVSSIVTPTNSTIHNFVRLVIWVSLDKIMQTQKEILPLRNTR